VFGTNPAVFGTNPAGFGGTNPAGIPAVPPALLLSTGATAVSVGDLGAGPPLVVPKSGVPKAVIVAVAATLGVLGIGAFALLSRSGGQPATASAAEQPAKTVAAPAAPPPEAPKPPEEPQRLGALPTAVATAVPLAPAQDQATAPAAAAHGSQPKAGWAPAVPAQHPAAAANAPPAASHPTAAAPKAPVNCNPPYTIDSAGVKHPKVECL
jgi:hypothetical protein